jgi:tetratricopeptide (TPR) repeat protein
MLSMLDRHEEAEAAFDQALSLDPRSGWALTLFVEAILRDPRTHRGSAADVHRAKARVLADALLHEMPDDAASHVIDGKCHLLHRNAIQAEQAARTALAIDPEDAAAHQVLGVALQMQGSMREAGDAYVAAGKLNPRSSNSGSLLEGLAKGAAPAGLVAFLVFQLAAKAGGRSAVDAGVPEWLVLAMLVMGIVVFVAIRRRRARAVAFAQLSPHARAVLVAKKRAG